jgi:hypothetical protein
VVVWSYSRLSHSCTTSSIDSLLINFFGGSEDFRKTEYGGLGVRRMREFNLALLGK